ncbi:hypothetical protein PF005_g2500 [Phytophthora fragariae]|uniref:Uncharacterized protein n=1 Tax=Phytophthora fragariae TaxID=53985 RepID=A0A6A3MCS9_9STRA|nr:hypothetical protein PF003_g29785 [Phytophthora fragariae]KAE9027610.1 hypothetical protein PF011_g1963 [Phytophthora fragariae]KAE9135528.1 hypothetical protein PF010_g2056 [Phytophthora fragariae]KAE9233001.1 hypothetical protein PF005_g2500 [Phytophthora fragariae]KAE9254430.1 hypothetical protein PF002_g2875 [Phytophthora fragariae]
MSPWIWYSRGRWTSHSPCWCLGTASLHVLFFTRRVQDASCAPVHGGVYEANHYCAYS